MGMCEYRGDGDEGAAAGELMPSELYHTGGGMRTYTAIPTYPTIHMCNYASMRY